MSVNTAVQNKEIFVNDLKRLEIANICYANVSGSFAALANRKNRGPNFSWKKFPDMMSKSAKTWIYLNAVSGNSAENISVAEQFAREIANTLLDKDHSNFLEESIN